MNNQMPYEFMPPFNQGCNCNKDLKSINEKVDNLEKRIKILERKVSMLESFNSYPNYPPMPFNN